MPAETIVVEDLIRGRVEFPPDALDDFALVRSDGHPLYHFCVCVDDADMRITHVIRGDDHLANTPKHVALFRALGADIPRFAHLGMILGTDRKKLSKRHGAAAVEEWRDAGILSEALVNYLALLGWSPGEGEELVPVREMARRFEVAAVGHSAAVFDTGKLAWMNRHYMKQATPARVARESLSYFMNAGFVSHATDAGLTYLTALLPMAVGSVDRLGEIPDRVAFVFAWNADAAAALVRNEPDGARVVAAFAAEIAAGAPLDREAFRAAAARVKEATGLKGRALFHPIRVAVTAAESGPELDLAIPAIDRGAALPAESGIAPILSCAVRTRRVAELLE
jgi:nondiscriminating glutamyl-tRNA synthetase